MATDRHARRRALLERFRSATRAQLDAATHECVVLDEHPQGVERGEAVARLRRSLQGIKGDAHMLGLASFAGYTEQLHDQLTPSPSELIMRQTLVGLEWLREWSNDELVEDPRAATRLAEGLAKLGEQAESHDASKVAEAPGSGRSVLLVDDSALVRMMVEDSLLDAGFEVEGAASGTEALRAVASSEPALVLSGVKMPGMSGFELLERLQAKWPQLPVVLLSGVRSATDEARARALGAQGYFLKGADLGPLVTHVLEHAKHSG